MDVAVTRANPADAFVMAMRPPHPSGWRQCLHGAWRQPACPVMAAIPIAPPGLVPALSTAKTTPSLIPAETLMVTGRVPGAWPDRSGRRGLVGGHAGSVARSDQQAVRRPPEPPATCLPRAAPACQSVRLR